MKKKIRVIDLTMCYNCNACENSCRRRHMHQRNVRKGKRVKHYILPIACRQCADPACVKACKAGAQIQEDGASYIARERCTGCGRCAKQCPYGSIRIISEKISGAAKPARYAVKCDLCRGLKNRACFSNCPSQALRFEDIDDKTAGCTDCTDEKYKASSLAR